MLLGSDRAELPALSWDDCRLMVENVVDYAILMLDSSGRIATWNRGAQSIKGYSESEIVGEHFSRFYPEADIAAGKPERALKVAAMAGRFEDEGWRIRKDGSHFWANVIITAIRDANGTLRGFGKVTRDLTACREAEERLHSAEQRFHHLVDAVIDYAIFMLDPDGMVATWNAGAHRDKGYTASEIVGKHFSTFYTPEDLAAGKPAAVLDIVRREGRFEEESWRIRKDGSRFWANVVITSLYDDRGSVIGFAKVTRDLTSRRHAEETARRLLVERVAREAAEDMGRRLLESEERYRSLSRRLEIILEGVADAITVQDPSGRVVFANSAAARLCGLETAAELMGTPPSAVLQRFDLFDEHGHPFDAGDLPGRRVLRGENAASALLRFSERGGTRGHDVVVRSTAVTDAQGRAELAINIFHDVTATRGEERRAKHLADATVALTSSLDQGETLSALASSLVPGFSDWCSIHLLDRGELRLSAIAHSDVAKLAQARAYHQRYGADPHRARGIWSVVRTGVAQLYNVVDDALLTGENGDPGPADMLRFADMKAMAIAPIRLRDKVVGSISLVSAESQRRFDAKDVALLEEIGRRLAGALENTRLFKAAQDAARVAEEAGRARDEFLATVSHELRTPLNAIVGWSALLKDRIKDPAFVKAIQVIYRNAQAQVKIIDDILDVSRVITGKFRLELLPVDLVAVVRDAIEVVRPSAIAKRLAITFVPSKPTFPLVGDPERLQQVTWNLLSNAVKFTDEDGGISIELEAAGDNIVLRITDSGRGIDAGFLPFVFDRFKQADSSITRRVGGLGLGLALVRHIVELHGGTVGVHSDGLGKGSSFTVTLPTRPVPAAIAADPARTTEAPRGATTRAVLEGVSVLVVDDQADARDLIAAVLADAGATVHAASSVTEAFEAFARLRPQVVVSDLSMPDEDGFSLMRKIRDMPASAGGRVPALALTALAREEDRAKAIAAGYTMHIGKPVDPNVLTSAVANLSAVARNL